MASDIGGPDGGQYALSMRLVAVESAETDLARANELIGCIEDRR